jgi:hypothetical protein
MKTLNPNDLQAPTINKTGYVSMTVESLIDIVESQICLYGNKCLFVRSEEEVIPFQLCVGDKVILECVGYEDRCDAEGRLTHLADRLRELDDSATILCSSELIQKNGFQIGIRSSIDGFVETISSTELMETTYVPCQ